VVALGSLLAVVVPSAVAIGFAMRRCWTRIDVTLAALRDGRDRLRPAVVAVRTERDLARARLERHLGRQPRQ
jgi:hypothetical protein